MLDSNSMRVRVEQHLTCVICADIDAGAWQCSNGHTLCATCQQSIALEASGEIMCPVCQRRDRVRRNRALIDMASALDLQWSCTNDGCAHVCPLAESQSHVVHCPARSVGCPLVDCDCLMRCDALLAHMVHHRLPKLSATPSCLLLSMVCPRVTLAMTYHAPDGPKAVVGLSVAVYHMRAHEAYAHVKACMLGAHGDVPSLSLRIEHSAPANTSTSHVHLTICDHIRSAPTVLCVPVAFERPEDLELPSPQPWESGASQAQLLDAHRMRPFSGEGEAVPLVPLRMTLDDATQGSRLHTGSGGAEDAGNPALRSRCTRAARRPPRAQQRGDAPFATPTASGDIVAHLPT